MSAIYKIVGVDGRQYGPVTAGQIRQWIAEGRVESRTPVFTNGAADWTFVGLLPEFAGLFPGSTPSTIVPPVQPRRTNSLATAGLVCGILSMTCFCFCGGYPFNILGLVLSLIGLSETIRHPELYKGRSLASIGLMLSVASIILGVGLVLISAGGSNSGNFEWLSKIF